MNLNSVGVICRYILEHSQYEDYVARISHYRLLPYPCQFDIHSIIFPLYITYLVDKASLNKPRNELTTYPHTFLKLLNMRISGKYGEHVSVLQNQKRYQ
jgi:hypothetical protein